MLSTLKRDCWISRGACAEDWANKKSVKALCTPLLNLQSFFYRKSKTVSGFEKPQLTVGA